MTVEWYERIDLSRPVSEYRTVKYWRNGQHYHLESAVLPHGLGVVARIYRRRDPEFAPCWERRNDTGRTSADRREMVRRVCQAAFGPSNLKAMRRRRDA